jgi:hypothetical protein
VLLLLMAGCGAFHGIQVFRVSIVNDTAGAVVVRDCDGYCSSSPIATTLEPGESAPINRTAKQHKIFSIVASSGSHVGCLDLYFPEPQSGAQVPVSKATPCRASSGPPWRTIALVVLGVGLVLVATLAYLGAPDASGRHGRADELARQANEQRLQCERRGEL